MELPWSSKVKAMVAPISPNAPEPGDGVAGRRSAVPKEAGGQLCGRVSVKVPEMDAGAVDLLDGAGARAVHEAGGGVVQPRQGVFPVK
jgi:hypothetical protein